MSESVKTLRTTAEVDGLTWDDENTWRLRVQGYVEEKIELGFFSEDAEIRRQKAERWAVFTLIEDEETLIVVQPLPGRTAYPRGARPMNDEEKEWYWGRKAE